MKKKVVRLTEAQLRSLVSEMLGGSSDDSWTQLDDAFASVKRTVQGLQGEIASSARVDPARGTVAHAAKNASAAVRRLQGIVDRIVASSGAGAGA